jgi:ribonuclease HI
MKKILKDLTEKFSNDPRALEAIEYLNGKLSSEKTESISKNLYVPKELTSSNEFALFSDGGCRGNPGPGAWAAVAVDNLGETLFEISSFDQETTNNKMELKAAIEGLKNIYDYFEDLKIQKSKLFFYTDSNYVVQGLNSWRHGWKKRGWRKSDNKPVENVELWKELDVTTEKFLDLKVLWVKGHSGNPLNERCDELCNQILDRELL